MNQYKYPIRYFCGPGLTRYTKQFIDRAIKFFLKNLAVENPILGKTGIDEVLLDFNCGLRLQIPEGNWHVRITEGSSGVVCFDKDVSGVTLISLEKFYVEWEITIWKDGTPIFYHQFDPTNQKIHFLFGSNALGDNIALLPYIEQFRNRFNCEASIEITETFHDIIRNYYPRLRLTRELPEDCYACFYFACWIGVPICADNNGRSMPLNLLGRSILPIAGLSRPSKTIFKPTKPRTIEGKYVCIGVQASYTPKCWLNSDGWDQVVDYLKSLGYRVLCIDRDRKCTNNNMTVEMSKGAEDFSGDYTLLDRINQLAYADFFIGVSSGLSWFAWAVDIPVVMISGITESWYEFDTPYRIFNPMVCHGCFNDMRVKFEQVLHCVNYKEASRKYECSKKISAQRVIEAIDCLIEERQQSGGS